MIGFWVVNLLIPRAPQVLRVNTPSGTWAISKAQFYAKSVAGIAQGQCAHTYAIETPVSMSDGAAKCDATFRELIPLLLGASYLTGLSATTKKSLPHSDVTLLQPGDHLPRERAMGQGNPIINNAAEFTDALEKFVASWPGAGQREKALLLVHHWLDSLACWSFEDLYLSATTLLQVIVATQEAVQGKELKYFDGVTEASKRAGLTPLSRDFKDMRNVLIHEGKLIGGKFVGTTRDDCARVAADVLNWFDEYLHSVLGLGAVRRQRFKWQDLMGLNAYSI